MSSSGVRTRSHKADYADKCVENSSSPRASSSLQRITKNSNVKQSKQQKAGNPSNLQQENLQKSSKDNEKPGSAVKTSTDLVETLACYKCKYCLFLSLSEDAVASHVQQEHGSVVSSQNNFEIECPGCKNVFSSLIPLRVHLSEDHNVAPDELENFLNTLTSVVCEVEYDENPELSGNVSDQHNLDQDLKYVAMKPNSPVVLQKHPAVKKKVQHVSTSSLSDETGKIRVRKMSSLEKSQHNIGDEFVEVDVSEINSSQIISIHEHQENSESSAGIHVVANHGANHGDIDLQYDLESIQMLDVPLDQQTNEPQVQLIEELSNKSASPATCDTIIDEICQEEVLDNILYVKSHATDEEGSPIMLCFAASPSHLPADTEDEDREMNNDDQLDYDNSLHSENVDDYESANTERIILSSCTLNGSDLVGLDGKKLVKRGYVKRPKAKKDKSQKAKIRKTPIKVSQRKGAAKSGYRCNVYGCSVRLQSHDNMEYHKRCHISSNTFENTLKITYDENTDGSEGKKGHVIHSKRTFSCPECFKELQSWRQTKVHLWKSHAIDIELHTCDQCGYKCASLASLKNVHEKIHGTERTCLCDVCGKGFKTQKQLRNHRTIHARKIDEVEVCETCGRSFHSHRMLRSHINTVHKKVRPYMCSECGHTAANRSSLTMHLRQHTGDRPYECEECGYKTADHNSLRRHKKRHTGDKPYKCPHCAYACIQSSTFKMHLRSKHPDHASSHMFSCEKCSFHSVSHDMYLAHVAEHVTAEAAGVPYKPIDRKRPRRAKMSIKSEPDEMPIYVSIATAGLDEEVQQQNFESIVQHVSEAIVPGSNLHVLYKSISVSDATMEDPIIEIIDDPSELQFIAEVDEEGALIEIPAEEFKLRSQDKKFHV